MKTRFQTKLESMGRRYYEVFGDIEAQTEFLKLVSLVLLGLLFLALFGLMGPLGASTSFILGAGMVPVLTAAAPKIMAIVIGIFLHISTTILFESSSNHRFNLMKMSVIIIGGIAGILLS